MSKYSPLRDHLNCQNEARLRMSFAEIEAVLGFTLPSSARRYPAWWANEFGGAHVQSKAWLDAGHRTADLDLGKKNVTFVRYTV